jgi:hypothetical protein
MPFKSHAQQAFFNANRDKLEGEGVDVDEWNAASKGKTLPQRVGKPNPSRRPQGKPRTKRSAAGYVPLTDLGM